MSDTRCANIGTSTPQKDTIMSILQRKNAIRQLTEIKNFQLMGTDTLRGMEVIEAKFNQCMELYSVGLLTLEEAKDRLRRG